MRPGSSPASIPGVASQLCPLLPALDTATHGRWCAAAAPTPMPATPMTVAEFLDQNSDAVQLRRVSAINRAHRDAGHPPPGPRHFTATDARFRSRRNDFRLRITSVADCSGTACDRIDRSAVRGAEMPSCSCWPAPACPTPRSQTWTAPTSRSTDRSCGSEEVTRFESSHVLAARARRPSCGSGGRQRCSSPTATHPRRCCQSIFSGASLRTWGSGHAVQVR